MSDVRAASETPVGRVGIIDAGLALQTLLGARAGILALSEAPRRHAISFDARAGA
jgi:hypothetical protein